MKADWLRSEIRSGKLTPDQYRQYTRELYIEERTALISEDYGFLPVCGQCAGSGLDFRSGLLCPFCQGRGQ